MPLAKDCVTSTARAETVFRILENKPKIKHSKKGCVHSKTDIGSWLNTNKFRYERGGA